jgi:hypothetical protein
MAFSNLTRIILYVVAGISLLVILFFYASPRTVDYDALELRVEEILNPIDMDMPAPLPVVDTTAQDSAAVEEMAVAEAADEDEGAFATAIWAYILVLLTAIAALVFPLIAVVTNPKGLIRLAGVLVGAAVLVIVSYLMSSTTPIDIIGYTGTANSDAGTLRMVDTTLFVTYMLFGIALLSILYSIISRAFK